MAILRSGKTVMERIVIYLHGKGGNAQGQMQIPGHRIVQHMISSSSCARNTVKPSLL